ncbi:MAG: metallophosphoesterase [Chlamydiota bacterium]
MTIWALADPHLSFGVENKSMEAFGPLWKDYTKKMEAAWREQVAPDDLVLIAGDISWAMRLEEVAIDLKWIDNLPGTKVISKGNHDYWWSSSSKLKAIMPPSIHFIHNSVFNWNGATIGGTRLWDSLEYNFKDFIHFRENPKENKSKEYNPSFQEENERIFERELERLKLSLKMLDPKARLRIAMTHYPPISADLKPSRASAILEEFNIDVCVFGHLHSLKKEMPLFGEARGVRYLLTSCDYLDFKPIRVI